MEIRKFNQDDIQPIYAFLKDLEPENGFENKFYRLSYDEFNAMIPGLIKESEGIDLKEGRVPQTLYFLWDHNEIVGVFKFRHYLNEHLINGSGHIGYSIKKEYRHKGYATAGLGMLCRECKSAIPEDEFYLSCLKTNKYSYKAMLANLGYLHHSDQKEHYVRIRKSIL